MLLVERLKVIWANAPANYTGAASTDKYVSLKKYGRILALILTGAWAAGTAAVTLLQATAVAGTGAKALAFDTMWTDTAATGTLVKTAVVSNTFNLAVANAAYVIDIDARTLDLANGFNSVAVDIASPGANADFYSVVYVLGDTRYEQSTPPSALVD